MLKKICLLTLLLMILPLQAAERLIVQFGNLAIQEQIQLPSLELISKQQAIPGVAIYQWHDAVDLQQQVQDILFLRRHEGINWVERDEKTVSVQLAASTELLEQQRIWHQPHSLYEAWQNSDSCEGVVVAVLDSGLDISHTDLSANVHINTGEVSGSIQDNDANQYKGDYYGWNAIAGNGDIADLYGHGTHVAGIVGAAGKVAGVCKTVEIMPVKFLDRFGNGSIADAAKAIYYVIALQRQFPEKRFIINNSWAAAYNSALVSAIVDAGKAGILLVNAAGNSGQDIDEKASYPAVSASYDFSSVTVANIDTHELASQYALHSRSNYGFHSVTLAAAGVDILSTWPLQDYRTQSGTSMATPIISGIAALIWSQNPAMTAAEVRAVLESAVDELQPVFGYIKNPGLVNAHKAQQYIHRQRPVAGFLQQNDSGVFVIGAYLDNVQQLYLYGRELAFTRHSSNSLQFDKPEYLRCGYLELHNEGQLSSKLYLDWNPRPPVLESVQRISASEAVLTWQADQSIDTLQIEVAGEDGIFRKVSELENNRQTIKLSGLGDTSLIRMRGTSACNDRYGQVTSKTSNYSELVRVSDLVAPVWHMVAVSNAVINQPYKIALHAQDAGSYELEPFQADECLPSGLMLSADGVIAGTPTELQECRFRVAALAESTMQKTVQTLVMHTVEQGDTGRQLFEGDELVLQLSFAERPVYGFTLQKQQEKWIVNWLQPLAEEAYEMKLLAPATISLANLAWLADGGTQTAVSANVHKNQASFIVSQDVAFSQNDENGERAFSLSISAVPVNQLSSSADRGDKRCFIATAVYRNNQAPEVQQLRVLRDHLLAFSPMLAEPVVAWYYRHSPQWVAVMEETPALAALMRTLLLPVLDGIAGFVAMVSEADQ